MKVQGAALAAYGRDPPVARSGEAAALRQSDSPAASRATARFSAEDFFSLSPQAQSGVLERMVLTSIGEKITAEFGEHGVNLEEHTDEDQSPDAVSSRIVAFATSLFAAFEGQNSDLDEVERLNLFEETLRGAVDSGYEQANGILDTIDGVDDDTKSVGATTMDLVHEKLDAFFAERRSGGSSRDDS